MSQFLEILQPTQTELRTRRYEQIIMSKEIESSNQKTSKQKKTLGQGDFTSELYQMFKEELTVLKLFQKTEKEGTFISRFILQDQ